MESRLLVTHDLLQLEDLHYEIRVRGENPGHASFFSLLNRLKSIQSKPVLAEEVQGLYPGNDMLTLHTRYGQIFEYFVEISEGPISDKQARRLKAKASHLLNRIFDIKQFLKLDLKLTNTLDEYTKQLVLMLDKVEAQKESVVLDSALVSEEQASNITDFNICPPVLEIEKDMNVCPLYKALSYSKLPHPLTEILRGWNKYNLSSLDNTLKFLIFLDKLQTQVRVLAFKEYDILTVMFPQASQPLADIIGGIIQEIGDFDKLHARIIEVYFPSRIRSDFLQRYFYRVQAHSETLIDYVRDIRLYARILRVECTEVQIVNIILDGISPETRSCVVFENRPSDFKTLESLCIKVMAISQCDALRLKETKSDSSDSRNQSNVVSRQHASHNTQNSTVRNSFKSKLCFTCGKPGHIARFCSRSRVPGNKNNSKQTASNS